MIVWGVGNNGEFKGIYNLVFGFLPAYTVEWEL
ncbi:Uncharacterised protein [Enterobacter cloacae]|uniref:Uncharacterized protein n=1 Tax=Enterobacter cloacae TaxID=550 RepID=A0A377M315_ENTCL|nr:Uncharacterised protein [Enterobacter cloacae]